MTGQRLGLGDVFRGAAGEIKVAVVGGEVRVETAVRHVTSRSSIRPSSRTLVVAPACGGLIEGIRASLVGLRPSVAATRACGDC
ncbi:Uncharacterised protein [Mycobacteroides abscessus subsp. abscessus]|nr:Uncharacterised protein [Mycobacteroides abscessus subsp. abscessus]